MRQMDPDVLGLFRANRLVVFPLEGEGSGRSHLGPAVAYSILAGLDPGLQSKVDNKYVSDRPSIPS